MVHRFWHADVVDRYGRKHELNVQSKGLPDDPKAVEDFLRTHNFPGAKSITNIKPVDGLVNMAGNPVASNPALFNAAGERVAPDHTITVPTNPPVTAPPSPQQPTAQSQPAPGIIKPA